MRGVPRDVAGSTKAATAEGVARRLRNPRWLAVGNGGFEISDRRKIGAMSGSSVFRCAHRFSVSPAIETAMMEWDSPIIFRSKSG